MARRSKNAKHKDAIRRAYTELGLSVTDILGQYGVAKSTFMNWKSLEGWERPVSGGQGERTDLKGAPKKKGAAKGASGKVTRFAPKGRAAQRQIETPREHDFRKDVQEIEGDVWDFLEETLRVQVARIQDASADGLPAVQAEKYRMEAFDKAIAAFTKVRNQARLAQDEAERREREGSERSPQLLAAREAIDTIANQSKDRTDTILAYFKRKKQEKREAEQVQTETPGANHKGQSGLAHSG